MPLLELPELAVLLLEEAACELLADGAGVEVPPLEEAACALLADGAGVAAVPLDALLELDDVPAEPLCAAEVLAEADGLAILEELEELDVLPEEADGSSTALTVSVSVLLVTVQPL